MPQLPDISTGAVDDHDEQLKSLTSQINEWGRQISNESRTSITNDDTGKARLLIGYQSNGFTNGNVGVKMSQSTYDVQSATSDQLVFSTDFNLFKIVGGGTANVNLPDPLVASTTYSKTVAHGLGYAPAFLAFVTLPSTWTTFIASETGLQQTPYRLWVSVGTNDQPVTCKVSVDSTNVYFQVVNQQPNNLSSLSGDMVFKYYLIRETAS